MNGFTTSMRNLSFLALMLLFSCWANAQTMLKGQVLSDGMDVMGVDVMNLNTEQVVKTDAWGRFELAFSPGEMLIIASPYYEYFRKSIAADQIASGQLQIQLIAKPIELDEVVITYDINPEDLGIVPKGQKIYTPAEKRLFAAQSTTVDYLLNAISGRLKQVKKEVQIEKAIHAQAWLYKWFPPEYYTKRLQIPAEYTEGFIYYAVSFDEVLQAINARNKLQTMFELSKLAPAYIEFQNEHQIELPTVD